MPLSNPVPRRHYHGRRIHCAGYLREDGRWDIEAELADTKTYPFANRERGTVAPGDLLHGLKLRLTIDDDMLIHGVEAAIDYSPYRLCGDISDDYQKLVGLRIRPGFTLRVKERVGGTQGCTHLTELVSVMATVAYQTVYGSGEQAVAEGLKPPREETGRPGHLGGCHALAIHSPVVEVRWPEHYVQKN